MSRGDSGSAETAAPNPAAARRETSSPRTFHLTDAFDTLARTPQLLRDWTQRLPVGAVVAAPHPAVHVARETLVRLAVIERRHWQPRIHAILTVRASEPAENRPDFARRADFQPMACDRLARFTRLRNHSLAMLRDMQPTHDWFLVHWVRPDADPAALSRLLTDWVASETAILQRLARTLAHRNALVAERFRRLLPQLASAKTPRPSTHSITASSGITHL